MPTTYDNQTNGTIVHYYANSGETCHPAIFVENVVVDDGPAGITEADMIQLDAISLGVVVPLRRNGVDHLADHSSNNTFHFPFECDRG